MRAPPREGASGGKCQIVFQNPYGSLNPRQSDRQGARGARCSSTRASVPPSARLRRSRIAWPRSGLRPEYYHRYPHMSRRQRQRIAIARALMLKPEDPGARRAGVGAGCFDPRPGAQLLAGLQEEFALAYVFVSHDLRSCAHRRRGDGDLPRQYGRLGERAAIFDRPQHPYYAGAPVRDAGRRPDRQAPTHPALRRAAIAFRAAAGLAAFHARAVAWPSIAAASRSRRSSASRDGTSPAGPSRHERRDLRFHHRGQPARLAACSPIG